MRRITVREFRAKGDLEAFRFWQAGIYPFDFAQCHFCLVGHAYVKICERHHKISEAVNKLGASVIYDGGMTREQDGAWLKANAPRLFALRRRFDREWR